MPRFPLHRTMGPLGVTAAVASSWWLAGGISASACVAAYQPKGAASLAASYTNLANPGTNDAAPGVAPTWAAATGWTQPDDGWRERAEQRTDLARWWRYLTPEQQVVLWLHFGEDMSYPQIARRLGVDEVACRRRAMRGWEGLRRRITGRRKLAEVSR